jgi:hypothetical protein
MKEEGSKNPSKRPTKLQMVKFRVWPVLIPMQTVHESEAAVETSSHPINGKHAERGRKGRLSIMDRFSCKA